MPQRQISSDPFTNSTSQHRTEVEPDTFASARRSWPRSRPAASSTAARPTSAGRRPPTAAPPGPRLPAGITTFAGGGPYVRVSDPAVAYDAKHNVWLISRSSLIERRLHGAASSPAARPTAAAPGANPVTVGAPAATWTRTGSPATTSRPARSTATATPSGTTTARQPDQDEHLDATAALTWGPPRDTGDRHRPRRPAGRAAQRHRHRARRPVRTRPRSVASARPTAARPGRDPATVATVSDHTVAGGLRTEPAALGRDRRRRHGLRGLAGLPLPQRLRSNDIVMQHVDRRRHLDAPCPHPDRRHHQHRRPLHPGHRGRPATSGATAHLALTYYFYPDAAARPRPASSTSATSRPPTAAPPGAHRRSSPGR